MRYERLGHRVAAGDVHEVHVQCGRSAGAGSYAGCPTTAGDWAQFSPRVVAALVASPHVARLLRRPCRAPSLFAGTHERNVAGPLTAATCSSLHVPHGSAGAEIAHHGWALDSGGFTQIGKGGWTMTPAEYLEQLVYDLERQVPGMEWAAPQGLDV